MPAGSRSRISRALRGNHPHPKQNWPDGSPGHEKAVVYQVRDGFLHEDEAEEATAAAGVEEAPNGSVAPALEPALSEAEYREVAGAARQWCRQAVQTKSLPDPEELRASRLPGWKLQQAFDRFLATEYFELRRELGALAAEAEEVMFALEGARWPGPQVLLGAVWAAQGAAGAAVAPVPVQRNRKPRRAFQY